MIPMPPSPWPRPSANRLSCSPTPCRAVAVPEAARDVLTPPHRPPATGSGCPPSTNADVAWPPAHAARDGPSSPTAEEAWITPGSFTLDGANRRQLRRVLRKVQEAEIATCEGGRVLPLDDMDRVAQDWKDARGGERGFSMGTYDRDYVSCQRVFLAYRRDRLVAFVTFHETRAEMTLDLMRQTADAPDGTIQQLILDAIDAAKAYGCPRVSLAAVPWSGTDTNPLLAGCAPKCSPNRAQRACGGSNPPLAPNGRCSISPPPPVWRSAWPRWTSCAASPHRRANPPPTR